MRRPLIIIAVVGLVACSGPAEEATTTTTTAPVPTTATSTTVVPTTIPPSVEIDIANADRELSDLVHDLYEGNGSEPAIPDEISTLMAAGEGTPPADGVAHVSEWDETIRLAVVEAENDVTLAIADPDWRIVGGWWPAMHVDAYLGGFPKLMAVIGSDARPGENRERTRADSIHLVSLDGASHAAIVGIPRDAWVPIPGRGNGKINAALAYGGPELQLETFAALTELEFDGYLLTGFVGFEGLIDVLGGLHMDVPRSFNDRAAKAYLDAGEQVLTAAEALALARVRKTIPGGDFQRQEHGGLVMMAAQAMIRATGVGGLADLLAASHPHFSTDLPPDDLLTLAAAIIRVDPENVVNVVAPGGTGYAGSASVVFLRDSAADIWADLADGRLEPEAD